MSRETTKWDTTNRETMSQETKFRWVSEFNENVLMADAIEAVVACIDTGFDFEETGAWIIEHLGVPIRLTDYVAVQAFLEPGKPAH